jgi:hypothetical protein
VVSARLAFGQINFGECFESLHRLEVFERLCDTTTGCLIPERFEGATGVILGSRCK